MPIYEYELVEGECKVCGGRFELRRPASRPPLERCPLCQKPVRKVPSLSNLPRTFSAAKAKAAGFTVLERKEPGVFERR